MPRSRFDLVDPDFRLSSVDLTRTADPDKVDRKLAKLQTRLMEIQHAYLHTKDRAVIVFEGWDAAGKGGTIRRLSAKLDPRSFKVWPIAAPTEAERAHHYLWRFWARLPAAGEIVLFDRSWYGRVLVERVEAFTPEPAWRRAYDEINAFERMLTDDGTRIVKVFLHVSPEEQARRFADRLRDPHKRWKLGFEDLRNRAHEPAYVAAIEEMVQRTSTATAPWHVLPSEDKDHARLAAMRIVVDRLSDGVDLSPRPLDPDLLRQAQEQLGLSPEDVLGDRGSR